MDVGSSTWAAHAGHTLKVVVMTGADGGGGGADIQWFGPCSACKSIDVGSRMDAGTIGVSGPTGSTLRPAAAAEEDALEVVAVATAGVICEDARMDGKGGSRGAWCCDRITPSNWEYTKHAIREHPTDVGHEERERERER
jgi:hypothetical protein